MVRITLVSAFGLGEAVRFILAGGPRECNENLDKRLRRP
jgi:hypothetical protein